MKFRWQCSGYVSNSFFVGNQAQAYAGAGGAGSDGATAYVDYTLIALNQSNLNGGAHNSGGMAAWNGSWGGFINVHLLVILQNTEVR